MTPSTWGVADETPTAEEVADAIGVDPGRLQSFVKYHQNPTPAAILGFAEAAPEHEDLVARWLDDTDRGYGR